MDQYLFDSLVENKTLEFDGDEELYMFTTTLIIGVVVDNGQMHVLESIDAVDGGEGGYEFYGLDYKGRRYDLSEVEFSMYSMGIYDQKNRLK